MQQLDVAYFQKYGRAAEQDGELVYYLGDRFEWSRTWSAHSGRIPCYRHSCGKYLHRASMQLLTGQEKLCSMGWPITPEVAREMGCAELPSLDPQRSHFLAGNSMHVGNMSVILLIALSCFSVRAQ